MVAPAVKFEVGKTYNNVRGDTTVTVEAIIGQRLIARAAGAYFTMHTLDGKFVGHWWNDNGAAAKAFYPATSQSVTSLDFYDIKLPEPPKPPITAIRVHPKTGTSDEARHPLSTFLHTYNKGYVGILINDPEVGTEDVFYSYEELKNTKYWSIIK